MGLFERSKLSYKFIKRSKCHFSGGIEIFEWIIVIYVSALFFVGFQQPFWVNEIWGLSLLVKYLRWKCRNHSTNNTYYILEMREASWFERIWNTVGVCLSGKFGQRYLSGLFSIGILDFFPPSIIKINLEETI